jgi:hypothetical protein
MACLSLLVPEHVFEALAERVVGDLRAHALRHWEELHGERPADPPGAIRGDPEDHRQDLAHLRRVRERRVRREEDLELWREDLGEGDANGDHLDPHGVLCR